MKTLFCPKSVEKNPVQRAVTSARIPQIFVAGVRRHRVTTLRGLIGMALAMFVMTQSGADDWPGWMGEHQDDVYRDTGVISEIPATGLPVRWRVPVATGYAGPAVADGRVFVFDYQTEGGEIVNDPGTRVALQGRERITALDVSSGEQLWQHDYDCPYRISYPSGPRCTPTVDGDRLYSLGSEGDFRCLETVTGALVWSRQLKTELAAEVPVWGFCSHPLVDGDLVYCMVGGDGQGVVAFNKLDGTVAWKSLDTKAGYCPLSVINAGGVRQLIAFHPKAVSSLNPLTGDEYWSIEIAPEFEMSIAKPVRSGNRLYASAIYNEALMIELSDDAPSAKELWRGEPKNAVHSGNSTPIFTDGVIYGTDCVQGSLIAVDADNGDRLWQTFRPTQPDEKRFIRHGTAFLTRLGDSNRYLTMSETGDLIVAQLDRQGYTEHGRFHVLDPTAECFGRKVVWSHPAYANKTAYIRNDKEIVAVSIEK